MAARTLRRTLYALIALVGGFVIGLLGLGYTPVLAASCPTCFGFERAQGNRAVHVEPDAGVAPDEIAARYEVALARVEAAFGPMAHHPVVVTCVSRACNRRMGGHGTLAMTYGYFAFYLGPKGHDTDIIAHELAHVALHHRIGMRDLGRFPAWVDEGLATYVSADPRYDLNPETCTTPLGPLPTRARDWRHEAAHAQVSLYAQAGCAVAKWFADHPTAGIDDLIAAHLPPRG